MYLPNVTPSPSMQRCVPIKIYVAAGFPIKKVRRVPVCIRDGSQRKFLEEFKERETQEQA